MENDVLVNQIEVSTSHEGTQDNTSGQDTQTPATAAPSNIKVLIRSLIERYSLTREQFTGIYDEYVTLKAQAVADAGVENATGEGVKAVEEEEMEHVEEVQEGASENAHGVQGEVGKMQNLVRSAIESYETSPLVFSELGVKRKMFTLEEELNLQPSTFAQELLDREQTLVAQAIKRYMNQYSIPQREVVEKTGLNQSHLSQHFLHGVTMKSSKRIKLYHWFEEDQKLRTGKLQSADGSLSAVLETPKVEGNRRRPRWKWSPISTQILTEAFKKNQFPSREQRLELARVCNQAEVAMNNGSMVRGPEGDTEGITEQRVNTWFTNRRKGLTTPSPTRATTPSSSTLLTPGLPPLFRATPGSTPSTPGHILLSGGTPLKSGEEKFVPTFIPTNVQTLVNQIQQAQVSSSSQIPNPQVALPVAIALPGASAPTSVFNSTSSSISSPSPLSTPTPIHTVTVTGPTVIPSTQFQALISQLNASSPTTQMQFNATTPTNAVPAGVITVPAAAAATVLSPSVTSSLSGSTTTPTTIQTLTLAGSPPTTPVKDAMVPTLAPGQVQALLSQLQQHTKIQGSPQLQLHPGSAVPLTLTLPGVSNEDLAKAIMLTNTSQSISASQT